MSEQTRRAGGATALDSFVDHVLATNVERGLPVEGVPAELPVVPAGRDWAEGLPVFSNEPLPRDPDVDVVNRRTAKLPFEREAFSRAWDALVGMGWESQVASGSIGGVRLA